MIKDLEKLKKKKEKMARDVGRMKEEKDKLAAEIENLDKLIKFDSLNKSAMWEIPDDLFAQLVPIVGATQERRGSVESIGEAKKRRALETAAVLNSVFLDIHEIIEQNRARFDYKMQEQTKRLEDAIGNSTKQIIAKIGDGPYKRLRDLDIRHIWQDNVGRFLIKAPLYHLLIGLLPFLRTGVH